MELDRNFSFKPLPPIENPVHLPFRTMLSPLGPLQGLPGTWMGSGFNVIWRPFSKPGQDHFLELNLTDEKIEFDAISGAIPNRGLLQPDMNMFGVHYLDQISDHNVGGGLHIEPGIWAVVPATTNPAEPATVVRMASIPHGTTVLAQGVAKSFSGAPDIPDNDIVPFFIGQPTHKQPFPESTLATPTAFRSPAAQLVGITQDMVNNPNSVLQEAVKKHTIIETVQLDVSSSPTAPVLGGGTSNTAFLQGTPAGGPNAQAVLVNATLYLMTAKGLPGEPNVHLLYYSQTVMLNFAPLTWPHVTVATLKLQVPKLTPIRLIDPDFPEGLIDPTPPTPDPGAIVAPRRGL